MPANSAPSFIAGENIPVSVFVKQSRTAPFTVLTSDDTEPHLTVGISHEGTQDAPIPGVTGYAANSGNSCPVYGLGEQALLVAGDAIDEGNLLKSDADGYGVPAAAGEWYSARALESCAAGQKVRVLVERGVTADDYS